jgi:mono/diheme cytochrome c family protein
MRARATHTRLVGAARSRRPFARFRRPHGVRYTRHVFKTPTVKSLETDETMTRLKLSVTALAVALFALACATNTNTNTATNSNRTVTVNSPTNAANANAPAPANDALAAARTTYGNACIKCHKENGEGGVVDIDGDKLRVPSFKGGHALKHSDADYVKQITNGGEGMPKFKDRLTPEQIDGLVHFIRAEFQAGLNTGGASNANANASK